MSITDPNTDTAASSGTPTEAGELPWIVSVDDHVVEPPHVWETWLPNKFKDRGPKVERRGIGAMKHIGGGAYAGAYAAQMGRLGNRNSAFDIAAQREGPPRSPR